MRRRAAQRPSSNNTPAGINAMLNFNINYKYLSTQQGNNLTITLAPSTVLNAKRGWGARAVNMESPPPPPPPPPHPPPHYMKCEC